MKGQQDSWQITVMGKEGSGKSFLLGRFMYDKFCSGEDLYGFDSVIQVQQTRHQVHVTELFSNDLSMGSDFSRYLQLLHRSHVFIYCIAASDTQVNDEFLHQIMHGTNKQELPMVICLTMSDTAAKYEPGALHDLIAKCKCPYIETSAKDGTNVQQVFAMALDVALKQPQPQQEVNKKCSVQ